MRHYFVVSLAWRCLLPGLLLTALTAQAQVPAWTLAVPVGVGQGTSTSRAVAVAADAAGNLLVTGYFKGQVTFGSTVLTSAGGTDLYVAKYVPSTWAWAVRGGGTGDDQGRSIALRGTSIYLAGSFTNNLANAGAVTLGASGTVTQYGASPVLSQDMLLAKYTDLGNSAAFEWSQVGGGTGEDTGTGVAVGSGGVYLTGTISTNAANVSGVQLGGSGTVSGTVPLAGSGITPNEDLLLAKYTDGGTTAALVWTQVGGGSYGDSSYGLAVSGANIYLTGTLANDAANGADVHLGGNGTTPGTGLQYGAGPRLSSDVLLAKYTDQGATGALAWTQIAGGTETDFGQGVAVHGNSVYVLGTLTNNRTDATSVRLGGSRTVLGTYLQYGTSATTTLNLLLAKYIDNGATGSFAWSQVGGGNNINLAGGVAVSGTSVYVTGAISNDRSNSGQVVFGGEGTSLGTVPVAGVGSQASFDLLVARYADQGATGTLAWVQVGGGESNDSGSSLAVTTTGVYAVGGATAPATFGSIGLSGPTSTAPPLGVLTGFAPTALAARAPALPSRLLLWPNPTSRGGATLRGATPGTVVEVVDALGRLVTSVRADVRGVSQLTAELRPGLYVVRNGTLSARLAVE